MDDKKIQETLLETICLMVALRGGGDPEYESWVNEQIASTGFELKRCCYGMNGGFGTVIHATTKETIHDWVW